MVEDSIGFLDQIKYINIHRQERMKAFSLDIGQIIKASSLCLRK